jgi:predicted AlkP superfamily pyrophosphatase or phosphodiesterase
MTNRRRVVFVCCDGLGRDWVSSAFTPVLRQLADESHWYTDHRAVFPSVTRVSAASIATGCEPRHHGLHGNRMGLLEQGRLVVRDVGNPDFRDHLRRATGKTLHVPTLAERVAGLDGFIAFSNVSAGAAYFLDPDHFGHVYHRAGSYAPGGSPLTGSAALNVSHDLAGDSAMTERFCTEVLVDRRPSVAVLWLANPDLTLHGAPLGSPAHHAALQHADRCVRQVAQTVQRLRAQGEDILLLVGSDHGQESIGNCVDIEAWLHSQGLQALLDDGSIAVAGQGTAALLYATQEGRPALLGVLDALRAQPWAGDVIAGEALAERGMAAQDGIVAAVNMARLDHENPYGVRGHRWTVAEPGKAPVPGDGQHGGWGPDETRPFLIVNHVLCPAAAIESATSLVDIAPTILAFLGLPIDGTDGRPLIDAELLRPR